MILPPWLLTLAIVAGGTVAAVALGWLAMRGARGVGEQLGAASEARDRLAESAERRAEADRVAALPIPSRRALRRLWRRYRRLRDPEGR